MPCRDSIFCARAPSHAIFAVNVPMSVSYRETPEAGAAAVGSAMRRGSGLVVPQSRSAVAEAQAVRVVPGLAGVAIKLPVPHRGASGLKALGLGRRVQPGMQR